jgi:nicotinamide riboside transporter PnuC
MNCTNIFYAIVFYNDLLHKKMNQKLYFSGLMQKNMAYCEITFAS